tara:strand:+ start:3496 stop:4182 length:687 start_codon:yes stop_codon:yes gene_type:complete
MFNEDEIKQLSFKFLQSFEEGNYAYDEELSKQTQKHYYKLKTTKQFFNDLIKCPELKHYSKEINHLLSMIQTTDYVREKQLINQIKVLKKQLAILDEKFKGHTRFTCPQCNSNINELAKKWNQEYIENNNLETYQSQIERLSDNLSKYNMSCRRLEQKIRDKDDLISELKTKINDLKTEHIHTELASKKKKKKKTSSKKDKKKLLKLLAQQLNDSSSEEESSSSDDEY